MIFGWDHLKETDKNLMIPEQAFARLKIQKSIERAG